MGLRCMFAKLFCCAVVQNELQLCRGVTSSAQPLVDMCGGMQRGHAIALGLLAGANGYLLPVLLFFIKAIAAEFDFGALGKQRRNFTDAKLRRFLHNPVHALAARHANSEMQVKWGLTFDIAVRGHFDADPFFPHRQ